MSESQIALLEADLAARRARLADTLGELAYRSKPEVIIDRQVAKAKRSFARRAETAKTQFVDVTQNEDGSLRLEVVGALTLTAVVLLAVGWRRHRR